MFAITIEHVLSGTSLRGYNLQTIEVTLIEWSAVDAALFAQSQTLMFHYFVTVLIKHSSGN
jgi:hypothetical protein